MLTFGIFGISATYRIAKADFKIIEKHPKSRDEEQRK